MASSGGATRDRDAALERDYLEAAREGMDDPSIFGEAFKQALGSEEARQRIYRGLAHDMLNGIPLTEVELITLSYGIKFDDEAARPVELEGLIPQLARQEVMNPGSTQVESIASWVEQDKMFTTVEQVFPFMGGLGGGSKAAATAVGRTGFFGSLRASARAHPVKTALPIVGGIGVLGYAMGSDIYGTPADDMGGSSAEGLGEIPSEGGFISTEDYKDLSDEDIDTLIEAGNIIVFDSRTGREIPIGEYNDQELLGTDPSGGSDPSGGGSFSPALIERATALGLTPAELANLQVDPKDSGFGTINPLYFGEISVPFNTFPYGVDISTGEALRYPRHRRDLPAGLSMMPEEDKTRYEVEKAFVPPGGQINPRAFATYQGQTLLEIVAETAHLYNVPVELLYGLINAESGFITNAMTPDGTRVGLAQIDLAEYTYLTPAQATNPRFSIGWAGRSLAAGNLQYGSMPASIASQMSHDDAEYLKNTGEFANQQSAQFVENVYGYAGASGVGNMRYEPGQLPPVRTVYRGGSGSSGGIKIPPYQAPDPDALRQITRLTRQEALERDPLDEEYTGDIAKLNAWYKEKYNADVAKIQGKTSTAVDPQAKYEEYIRGLGEFEYREESRDTRDIMDFMGEIVRIMQGV